MEEERGRPSVMEEAVIAKLEEAFLNGASDEQAAFVAGIAPRTLYYFCSENPDFAERKELLKEQVKYRAKLNIATAINAGDKQLSQWLLERKDSSYNPKQQVELKGKLESDVSLNDNQYQQLIRLASERLSSDGGSEEVV